MDVEKARRLAQRLHVRYLYIHSGLYVDQRTGSKVRGKRLNRIRKLGEILRLASMTDAEKDFVAGCLGFRMVAHADANGGPERAEDTARRMF